MKAILISFLLTAISQITFSEDADSIWKKAVNSTINYDQYYPSVIEETEKIFTNGKLDQTNISQLLVSGDIKKPDFTLKYYRKNGKNISEKELLSMNKELKMTQKNEIFSDEINPFSRVIQQNIYDIQILAIEKLQNRDCYKISYKQKIKENSWKGIAWINSTTGIPVKISVIPLNRIKVREYENITLTNFKMTSYYSKISQNLYAPDITYIKSDFIYSMKIYKLEGKIESRIKYLNYRK